MVDGSSSATNGSGLYVYVLIWSIEGSDGWWIQPTTTFPNGSWQSHVYVGEDPELDSENSRRTYVIVAIITPQELKGNQKFVDIPSYVAKSNEIIVTRTAINKQKELREAQERRRLGLSMRERVYREIANNYVELLGLNALLVEDLKRDSQLDERQFQHRLATLKKLRCDQYISVKSNLVFLEQLEKQELNCIEDTYNQIFWTLRNDEMADQRNAVSSDLKESPRDLFQRQQEFIAGQIDLLENLILKLDKDLLINASPHPELLMHLFKICKEKHAKLNISTRDLLHKLHGKDYGFFCLYYNDDGSWGLYRFSPHVIVCVRGMECRCVEPKTRKNLIDEFSKLIDYWKDIDGNIASEIEYIKSIIATNIDLPRDELKQTLRDEDTKKWAEHGVGWGANRGTRLD